jgi:hypothetical protein
VDYRGRLVANQSKHIAIVNYDVGDRDLQQCADAMMRLRAEFLFSSGRYHDIAFHFTNGKLYPYKDFLAGRRPRSNGSISAVGSADKAPVNHATLRQYLDIVYTYASTISLGLDLQPASDFAIGTIILAPGSPGHCCIITDERIAPDGTRRFKLAESYMPAQSIYILKNPVDGTAWHALKKGAIETASYRFTEYDLKKFE